MECSSGPALRGGMAIMGKVRTEKRDGAAPRASRDARALTGHFVGTAGWRAMPVGGMVASPKRTVRPGFRGRV
jgi:hypothetical protein